MEERLRILLCEDDENLGMLLREYLQAKGYNADLFPNGEAGYKAFLKGKYDLCVFDVMMPKKDGFTLAQEVRTVNSEVPIIFLTAKSLKEDILEGFKIGADDYITKPFSMEELVFRIEAILRRVKGKKGKEITMYKIGKFTFDTQKQVLMIEDKITKLTTKESELLSLLCAHVNEILERNFALKTIWIDDNYFNARSMDVYITKLRKHLKAEKEVNLEISNKQYTEKKADLEAKKAELDDIIAETHKDEEALIKKSEELSQNIEERLLTAYRKIRDNARNGLAVVTVDRDACGGCFNKIPPQRQLDIRSRKKIIVCEYCGRILIDKYICDYDGSMQKADLESAMEAQKKKGRRIKKSEE